MEASTVQVLSDFEMNSVSGCGYHEEGPAIPPAPPFYPSHPVNQ